MSIKLAILLILRRVSGLAEIAASQIENFKHFDMSHRCVFDCEHLSYGLPQAFTIFFVTLLLLGCHALDASATQMTLSVSLNAAISVAAVIHPSRMPVFFEVFVL